MDHIFWVRWPERTETLNIFKRIMVAITFLFFHLIVQIYWNRIFVSNKFIYELADNLPTFLAFLFVRLVSASTFVSIIGTFYRYSNQNVRIAILILSFSLPLPLTLSFSHSHSLIRIRILILSFSHSHSLTVPSFVLLMLRFLFGVMTPIA
jgi:hypothetical protein